MDGACSWDNFLRKVALVQMSIIQIKLKCQYGGVKFKDLSFDRYGNMGSESNRSKFKQSVIQTASVKDQRVKQRIKVQSFQKLI